MGLGYKIWQTTPLRPLELQIVGAKHCPLLVQSLIVYEEGFDDRAE